MRRNANAPALAGAWITALSLLVASASILPAQERAGDVSDPGSREELQFLEILLNARPAPQPNGRVFPESVSASPESRAMVAFDPITGREEVTPASLLGGAGTNSAPPREAQWPWSEEEGPIIFGEIPGLEGIENAEPAGGPACTPPSPYTLTHSFPWNTTYKLLMRFNVSGTNYFYVCSASPFGPFQLLTAGHCLYNHDPNDDGNTSDARWASEVWAWAAQTDLVNPFSEPDFPYSYAKSVLLRTYIAWTNNADLNHDMGYITLDRRDPMHTGSMGREWGIEASLLNFNGYPVETPFVPAGELMQYPGSDSNNVTFYTPTRIRMCAYTYGGHSGGPDWRFDGTNRYIQGVNSTSDRAGAAEATRITEGKFNDMFIVIDDDEANRPPVARPDIAEYVFTTVDDRKDLLATSVLQDHPFQIEYNAFNAGFAHTGTLTIDFYLSTNAVISSLDTQIGSVDLAGLGAFNFTNPLATLNATIAPGTYYAGWIMSTAVPEYGGDGVCTNDPCSNVVVIADETLSVMPCGDSWEPDNSSGQANPIFSGAPQGHGLCPIGDEDWYVFTLAEPSTVLLGTSGPSGDTRMWLYNSRLIQIEFDDDDGPGLFSEIDRLCGVDALPAGTYFVQVDEFGDNNYIDSYTMSFDSLSCMIFSDGLESGNMSAWSYSVP